MMRVKKKGPKQSPKKTSEETHLLTCDLTTAERAASVMGLCKALEAEGALDAERKATMSEFKSRKDKLAEQVGVLRAQVETGKVIRPVKCSLTFDYVRLTATVKRMDTCEVIEERDMNSDEKQMDLGFDTEAPVTETD